MFDKQSLSQLRGVMVEVIQGEVPAMVQKIVREVIQEEVPAMIRQIIQEEVPLMIRRITHEELDSLMEHQILPQFNKIYSEFDSLRNRYATKDFVEERVEKFRVDVGLRYRKA